jgi:hypothetical protein
MESETLYTTLIALTVGLSEVLKQIDPEQKFNRYYPLVTEILGFSLGMLAGINWLMALTVGLGAMGLYRGAKVVIKGE